MRDNLNCKLPPAYTWLLVLGSWLLVSCELPTEESIYEEKLVVFGHLVANAPVVDTFFVSLTHTIDEPYEGKGKWISNANMILSDGQTSFKLTPVEENLGGIWINRCHLILYKQEKHMNCL